MAAIVYRGPMAKLFLWTIFTHDFELYRFDRELSYDFGQMIVGLLWNTWVSFKKFMYLYICLSV